MTTRPADLAARLLRTEADALLPILRRTPAAAFGRPTVCTGWSVRDVLGHCAAALVRLAEGRLHQFTPEQNEADVAERRPWPLEDVLDELARGYSAAAPALTAASGRGDGIALGEWVHGGDVREALGEPLPYASDGIEDALVLLVERSQARAVPPTRVSLPDRQLLLGVAADPGRLPADLVTDPATLVRLCSGRRPDPARYTLRGADPDRYRLFG
jgi:uncharacterized protein (TIGR03083 family)